MTTLIRVGNTIINLDNVTHVAGDSVLVVYFNAQSDVSPGYDAQSSITFRDEEAAILREYLIGCAVDVRTYIGANCSKGAS
jgi:hypothetical protein